MRAGRAGVVVAAAGGLVEAEAVAAGVVVAVAGITLRRTLQLADTKGRREARHGAVVLVWHKELHRATSSYSTSPSSKR